MKQQLAKAELKNKRLMEAFKKTSQEFREVCYQLLGYRIDISSANQYKLMNMYSESPEDFLLFKVCHQRPSMSHQAQHLLEPLKWQFMQSQSKAKVTDGFIVLKTMCLCGTLKFVINTVLCNMESDTTWSHHGRISTSGWWARKWNQKTVKYFLQFGIFDILFNLFTYVWGSLLIIYQFCMFWPPKHKKQNF